MAQLVKYNSTVFLDLVKMVESVWK